MNKLASLMETEEMKSFFENNQELIAETALTVENFKDVIKEYVLLNPEIFMDGKVENIKKNIRIFTEAATSQYMSEVTTINSSRARIIEPITPENALNDYI